MRTKKENICFGNLTKQYRISDKSADILTDKEKLNALYISKNNDIESVAECLSVKYGTARNRLMHYDIINKRKKIKELYSREYLTDKHHNEKMDVYEIANELSVTHTVVRNALKRQGVELLNKHTLKFPLLLNLTKDKLDQYLSDCLLPKDISPIYDCSINAIRYRMKIFGLENRENIYRYGITDERLVCGKWLRNASEVDKKTPHEIAKELGCHVQTVWGKLNDFDIKFIVSQGISEQEKLLCSMVRDKYDGEIIEGSKKIIPSYQLDMYFSERKIAVEYNGVYHHSHDKLESTFERNYHKMKTDMCQEKGIQLIHIDESQFLGNPELVLSFILNKLGMVNHRIYARKTTIEEIDKNLVREFLDENHLQGYVKTCSINYGLVYEGDLVSLMSFAKSRFDNKNKYELIRFANKKGTNVIGGASKLLKHFTRSYDGSIVSYADRSYSDGKLYETLGFTKTAEIPARYFYTKGMIKFNRMHFQKKKLASMKNFIYDPDITEGENMFNNGYRRMWDSGKLKYVFSAQNIDAK